MRDQLIGYLLGALDPEETAQVEQLLAQDPQAQQQMNLLQKGIAPLAADRAAVKTPAGLAQRVCQMIKRNGQADC